MENRLPQLKYNQIRLNILDYIANQGLQIGDRLPPERTFTQMLNCSSGTMRIALRALEENGLIEKRHGMGSYLKRKVTDMAPTGSVLYVSVVRKQINYFYPPSHLHHFFAQRNLLLDHISVLDPAGIPRERLENCQGILLTGWLTDDLVRNFQALGLPLIIIGNYDLHTDAPIVSTDLYGVAHRLTSHFARQGKKRIAFWAGEAGYISLQQAQQGYEQAMADAGLKPLIMEWDSQPPCKRLASFMQHHRDVDVFIAEQPAFYEYCMVRIEHSELPIPQFGILPLLHHDHYTQGKNIIFGDYQKNHILVAAEQLANAIATQSPMKSVVVPPILHGIDDDLTDFEIQ